MCVADRFLFDLHIKYLISRLILFLELTKRRLHISNGYPGKFYN